MVGAVPDAADTVHTPAVEQLVVEQTNALRHSHGLAAASVDAQLEAAARAFAQYMARTDRYGHEADGRQPAQRAAAQGYDYCLVSENLAYQFSALGFSPLTLAGRLVKGWEHSLPHRHNMLDADAVNIGVGVAQSRRSGRFYAVQMFGRPAAMRITFRVANRSPATLRYELGRESFELPPQVTRTHEQCHVDRLSLHLPGQAEAITFRPANGQYYAVDRVGLRYRFTRS